MWHNGELWTYTWDGENRLIKAELPTQKVECAYDYQGRRVSKKTYAKAVGANELTLSKTEKYVYDGTVVIAEFNADNVLQKSYLWGMDIDGGFGTAGGVGGLLAENNSNSTYLPAYDGNGNVMVYINATDKSVAAEYCYNAFGGRQPTTGALTDVFAYGFSTQRHNPEIGDISYLRRDYTPDLARWKNRDPMGEFDTYGNYNQLYGFVKNNPINAVDYWGLEWHINRNGNTWAIASRDDIQRDTIAILAQKIKLNSSEAKKWLRNNDGTRISDSDMKTKCKFNVPNKIVIAVGGDLPSMSEHFLVNMANDVYSQAKSKNFYVVYRYYSSIPFSNTQLESDMKDGLWGFALYGHGIVNTWGIIYGGNGAFRIKKSNVASEDGGTADNVFYSHQISNDYKYALVIAKLCSAQYGGWGTYLSGSGRSYISFGPVTSAGVGYFQNLWASNIIE